MRVKPSCCDAGEFISIPFHSIRQAAGHLRRVRECVGGNHQMGQAAGSRIPLVLPATCSFDLSSLRTHDD